MAAKLHTINVEARRRRDSSKKIRLARVPPGTPKATTERVTLIVAMHTKRRFRGSDRGADVEFMAATLSPIMAF